MTTTTEIDRFVGRCKFCGARVAVAAADVYAPTGCTSCQACGCGVKVAKVVGTVNDTRCSARCWNSTTPDCKCSCGGAHHGEGN